MTRSAAALACCLLPLSVWAQAPPGAPPDPAVLRTFLHRQVERARLPGAAVVVVRGDSVVFADAVGGRTRGGAPLTPDTPFLIGSLSKAFTALAVLHLVEEGRVDLDAPVMRYLPRLRFADAAGSGLTVRHLLHHTSGISESEGFVRLPEPFSWEEAPFERVRLRGAPGGAFAYSNLNYVLLGLLVEAVTGRPYAEYVETQVVRPLNLTRTSAVPGAFGEGRAQGHQFWYYPALPHDEAHAGAAVPAGFVAASGRDLGRFLSAHLDTTGARLGLSPDLLRATRTPPNEESEGYGMGWRRATWQGTPVVQHAGLTGSYSSAMLYLPERGYGVAVLTDANSFEGSGQLARGVLTWLEGGVPEADRPPEVWWRLGALTGLLLASYSTARTAHRWNEAGRPVGWPEGARSWGALAGGVGTPVAVVVGVPLVTGMPLRVLLDLQPDLGTALVGVAVLGATAGVLRAVTPHQ